MGEKILLTTDCSEYSEGAIREAINLAKSCESHLYAMSVAEINPELMALAPAAIEKIETEIREHLEEIRDRAVKENVECEIIIREGEGAYSFIIDEADKKKADIIIMGRRGRTGLMRLLMGSVTERVIGLSSGKVLVVPRASAIKWKNIVIATDASIDSQAAVKEALALTKRCTGTSKLLALAVTQENAADERIQIAQDAVSDIKEMAEKQDTKTETAVITGKPTETIVEFAKEKNADIIVMGSHGRTGLKKLLMGSTTAGVVGHTSSAVLVVKG